MSLPKLLTLEEVASYTRTDPRTVQRWISSRKLDATKAGRRRLISEVSLLRFLRLREDGSARVR